MTEIKISDEDVAVVGFALCERASLPACDKLCEDCADDGRAVLQALVASGWRREALPTCQENAEPTRLGVFVDTHLHECAREQGHRSAVHRCACNTEWWEAEQYVSAGTREQQDQKRGEELEHG
jgi:hypothetical protein